MVATLDHFKGYVWGPKCVVRTDHAALVWLKNLKNIQGMLARWLAKLQQFHFERLCSFGNAKVGEAKVSEAKFGEAKVGEAKRRLTFILVLEEHCVHWSFSVQMVIGLSRIRNHTVASA